MALEMREIRETCGRGLGRGDEAYICSYECTFCSGCTMEMADVVPNRGGEWVRRSRRGAPTGPS